jgi:hypothetical protein
MERIWDVPAIAQLRPYRLQIVVPHVVDAKDEAVLEFPQALPYIFEQLVLVLSCLFRYFGKVKDPGSFGLGHLGGLDKAAFSTWVLCDWRSTLWLRSKRGPFKTMGGLMPLASDCVVVKYFAGLRLLGGAAMSGAGDRLPRPDRSSRFRDSLLVLLFISHFVPSERLQPSSLISCPVPTGVSN